jgi:uncharacterized protein YjdB
MKKKYLSLLLSCLSVLVSAQVTLISPTGNGGFETGATFAANGWTTVNPAQNLWQIGTLATGYSGARGVYVSGNGSNYNYNLNNAHACHFYRDVVIPAGATAITLSFQWMGKGETSWDNMFVYTAATSVVPVINAPVSPATSIPGATIVWSQPNNTQASYTSATVVLPNTLAGSTVRLIFTWINDGSGGTNPPAAVDNISLVYTAGPNCSGTPTAGTISSSSFNVCSGTPQNISLSGATAAAGITYQWESSPDNSTWTSVSGETNSNFIANITSSIYYHCVVGCAVSGLSAATPGVLFTVSPCYSMSFTNTLSATTCGGNFYDDGGPSGNYAVGGNSVYTFYPGITGAGSNVSVHFNSFAIETCCDWIKIFNGNTVSAGTLIGQYTSVPPDITSSAADGSLTFQFHSDVSNVDQGFDAVISNTYTNPITTQPAASTTACQGLSTSISITASGVTYQWFNNGTTNATTGGTLIAGATNASYSPSTATIGTTYYYCTVKNACNAPFTSTTAAVVVNPLPAAITGTTTVCQSLTTILADVTIGGAWSSSNSVASVTSGTVTGVAVAGGTSTISYTVSGCSSTTVVTVNPLPAALTGTTNVCIGATTTLNSASTGGTWLSGAIGTATVNASGVVSGIANGIAPITYTLPTSCITVSNVSVNPLPNLSITPGTSAAVCIGGNTSFTASAPVPPFTLLNQNFNSGLGSWAVTNTSGTSASYWQIVTSPGYDGTLGDGTPMMQAASNATGGATITVLTAPSFSTQGFGSAVLTFNQYLVSQIPDAVIKVEYSTDGGSTWTLLLDQLNDVSGSGAWAVASPEVTLSLPSGALGQSDVKLRWNYNGASYYWFIDNVLVSGSLPPATFAWTGGTDLSCTACASPVITPVSSGINTYTVTATSSSGCTAAAVTTVTVNALPTTITGSLIVCENSTTTLGSTPVSGTWSSSNTANATIGLSSGIVSGILSGTSTITYTSPLGCQTTAVVTINTAPAPITGTSIVCQGLTTSLTETSSGGIWSNDASGIASVNSSGVVTGNLSGPANISYTLPNNCYAIKNVTVNPLPAAIGGTASVCQGSTTTLSDSDPGGTWASDASGNATIDAGGIVSGILAGNATISYTLPTTCLITKIVSVNQNPAAITGSLHICSGLTGMLYDATPSGNWTSGNLPVADINTSGLVTGIAFGTADITFTIPAGGCYTTVVVTVDPSPATITGPSVVCKNATIALTDASSGGTWTSSDASVATIDASGMVTGINTGTSAITYTGPSGCISTSVVTVNPLPTAINGTPVVCENATTTLSDFTSSGTWSSALSVIASVDAGGIVTGNSAGMTDISYTLLTGCYTTVNVTVNHTPAPITGAFEICKNTSTTLGNTDAGGNWTSNSPGVAPVDASGNVTGIFAGNAGITYTLTGGCYVSVIMTIDPAPAPITGTLSVCEQSTTTLNNGSIGGTWSDDGSGAATVDASGVVTGIMAGNTGITYTLPTGCAVSTSVVVNTIPDPIAGAGNVCVGGTTTLTDPTSGGTWSINPASSASISSSGIVAGIAPGNATSSYTLSTGCRVTAAINIDPLPLPITGSSSICEGATTTLSSSSAGGNWTGTPTANILVTATGDVTGLAQGLAHVTYTLPTGCLATKSILVNPAPAAITGNTNVCIGLTTVLSNAISGGTWSSSASSVASVNSAGTVTGNTQGVATINYTLPAGCSVSASMVVNPLPAPITGNTTICQGSTATLSDITNGGTWLSSVTSVATIDGSGTLSGIAAGASIVTYTLPTGCIAITAVSVNPLPGPITGNTSVCQGQTTTFSNSVSGGTWSSNSPTIAFINAIGIATGFTPGFTTISYTLPTGCNTTTPLSVEAIPAPITGTATVCAGLATTLTNTVSGGSWSSATSVATVDYLSGLVIGIASGTVNITYALATGCYKTKVVTVNPLPALITGNTTICPGTGSLLANDIPGGTWSSNNIVTASIDAISGMVSGNTAGNTTITYTLPTGCLRTRGITVNPPVDPITGITNVCAGLSTSLTTTATGGVWISGNTLVATINPATGLVSSATAGNAVITYARPDGCKSTTVVIVNPLPASITGPSRACLSGTATLSNASAGGIWNSNPATIATINPTSGLIMPVSAGTTYITYTLATGCIRTAPFIVDALPAVQNVAGGGSYCEGGAGIHIVMDGSESNTTYKLYNGSTLISSMPGTTAALDFGPVSAAGTYYVTAVNIPGCQSTMLGNPSITIIPVVTPSVTITSDHGTNVCAGTPVVYTATTAFGGITPAYDWQVGGISMGTAASFNYTPANGNVVSVSMTSSEACPSIATVSDALSMTVIANQLPTATITTTSADTICVGQSAAYTATSTFGGTAPSYIWMRNGANVAVGTSFSYAPTNGDIIVCKLHSNYQCRSADSVLSNPISIVVDNVYIPEVTITADPGQVIAQGTNVTFTAVATGAGPAPSYQWSLNGGNVAGATNSTYTNNTLANNDIVACYVYGSGKCGLRSFNSVTITVDNSASVITTQTKSTFTLAPNPNNGSFTITGKLGSAATEEVAIEVTDVLGQIVFRNKVTPQNATINEQIQLSNTIANGMYLLNIHSGTEHATFHFVVKQ